MTTGATGGAWLASCKLALTCVCLMAMPRDLLVRLRNPRARGRLPCAARLRRHLHAARVAKIAAGCSRTLLLARTFSSLEVVAPFATIRATVRVHSDSWQIVSLCSQESAQSFLSSAFRASSKSLVPPRSKLSPCIRVTGASPRA